MVDRSRNLISIPAAILMIISFGKDAYGQCPNSAGNVVVYEGALNTILSCGLGPKFERWTVRPTSKVSTEYELTNFTETTTNDKTLPGLYAFNRSGLVIRRATTNNTDGPISTAGVYFVYFADGNKTAVKLVVIRSGPTCSYTKLSPKGVSITCTIIYADYPVAPVDATISCSADGQIYTGPSSRKLLSPYLYSTTAVIIANSSASATYDCRAVFTAPTSTLPYLAKSTPNFTANVPALEATTIAPTSKPTMTQKPTTTGRNSSLTRRPTNTAAVDGSSNIAFECASRNGTDSIRWSFSPLGSVSNETIGISSGYKLLATSNQKYELHATVNSSVLIVRQLSSSTEGTYRCSDGVDTASALLLVIASPISMAPLFGPLAGGTNITISGSITLGQTSRYVGVYAPNMKDAANVYIGNDLSAAPVSLLTASSSAVQLVVVTPSATEASIGQTLPVIIEFSPSAFNSTPLNMTFNTAFSYLPNPEITGIYPDSFIVDGGILVDVTGRSLSSVAKPIIQLTVSITRDAESSTSTSSTSRACTVPPGKDTFMQCPMPPLNIPDDFFEILNSQYRTNASRTRRSIQAIDQLISDFRNPLLSRKRRDTNALTLRGPNGIDQIDISLGFILDGYKKYENINDALPDTRLNFYSAPEINSTKEVLTFDSSQDEAIYIKGRYMLRGCRLRDYVVHIGNQICTNNDLQDNQLSCRPPQVEPSSTVNDMVHCDSHLSITITVGYKQYQYGCLAYVQHSGIAYSDQSTPKNIALIVGLSVGLGLFAIFLIIIIVVCVVRYRRNKVGDDTNTLGNPGKLEFRSRNYRTFVDKVFPTANMHWRPRYDEDAVSANDEYLRDFDGESDCSA